MMIVLPLSSESVPIMRPRRVRDVAHDGAGVLLAHGYLHVGHRLEEHGTGLLARSPEADARRGLERHLVGVDRVVAAVVAPRT